MPPKLRPVSGEETVRALKRLDFTAVRQRGSHVILKKQTSTGKLVALCLYIKSLSSIVFSLLLKFIYLVSCDLSTEMLT